MSTAESYKIVCPKCSATLKSPKPIPANTPVKCPQCKTLFHPVRDDPRVSAKPLPKPAAIAPAPQHPPSTADRDFGKPIREGVSLSRFLTVVAAMAVVIGLGGGLLWYCFRDSGSSQSSDDPAKVELAKAKEAEAAKSILEQSTPEFTPLPPRPLVVITKDEEDRVQKMVVKGVAFLKKTQLPSGTWGGAHGPELAALGALTLLECGVAPDDPVIVKAAQFVRQHIPSMYDTYGLAVYILFLDKLNDPIDKDALLRLAMRLAAGQFATGGWHYKCPTTIRTNEEDLLVQLLNDMGTTPPDVYREQKRDMWNRMPPAIQNLGMFQKPPPQIVNANFYRSGGDNSNTQFAILGLWAAKRTKAPVDRNLILAVQRFRSSQLPDGKWTYVNMSYASQKPTMTCAGLLGLAMNYGLGQEKRSPRRDPQIQRGLKIVSDEIQPNIAGVPDIYFLWSVERICVLFKLATINEKEWYPWGMALLEKNQRKEGFWQGSSHGGPIVDTCFALLFLQRANLAQDLTDKIPEDYGDELEAAPMPPLPMPPPAKKK